MKKFFTIMMTAIMAVFVFAGSSSAHFDTGFVNPGNGSLAMVVYSPTDNEYAYSLGVANNMSLYASANTLWTNSGNLTLTEDMSLGIFGCDVNESSEVPYYDVFFSSTSLNPTIGPSPVDTQAGAIGTLNFYKEIAGGASSVISPTSDMGYNYIMNLNGTTPGWMGGAIEDGSGEVKLADLVNDQLDSVSLYLYRYRLTLDDQGEVVKILTNLGRVTFDGQTLSVDSSAPPTDSDGDGVIDDVDQCPNTPAGATVNADGCSASQLDSDGDGVTNDKDQCSNTPIGATVDADGCSASQLDSDGDGVTDDKDQCSNTPVGETVDADGCSASQLDSDGDGVTNDKDQCSNTPVGATVDANGCSVSQLDSDNDGIHDDVDTCPDTPAGQTVDANGCADSQKDTDGDGVTYDKDQCPNTPAGATVDADGCSASQLDSDNDGIHDDVDTCPNTPAGQTVDANGCAASQKDTDNDGIHDDMDTCPNTPAGEAVNASGCSTSQIDSDGDGIMDNVDLCPGTPAGQTVNANGCAASQLDSDNDGIHDNVDICPDTPAGQTVNANGCAASQLDSDNDGIHDDVDTCPDTPAGQTVNASGCAASQLDSDNDSIHDDVDLCPGTPAGQTVDASGCAASQLDSDNDGIHDDMDQCPNTPAGETVSASGCSTSQIDTDGDGIMDNVDNCPNDPNNDADGDSVCSDEDNCPAVANIGQGDADGDNIGNFCDDDWNRTCFSQKVKEAGKLSNAIIACFIKEIKDKKNKYVLSVYIDALMDPEGRFSTKWAKAEDKKVKNIPVPCETVPEAEIANAVYDALVLIYSKIDPTGISDTSGSGDAKLVDNKNYNKLVCNLLSATSKMCVSLLNAESTYFMKSEKNQQDAEVKLEAAKTKAINAFSNSDKTGAWDKAIAKATKAKNPAVDQENLDMLSPESKMEDIRQDILNLVEDIINM